MGHLYVRHDTLSAACAVGHRRGRSLPAAWGVVPEEKFVYLTDLERLLAGVDVLEGLPHRELRALTSGITLRRLGRGKAMHLGPETHLRQVVLLLEGRARTCERGDPERTVTALVAEAGTVVGVTGMAENARGLTVEALEEALLGFLGREVFEGLLLRNPGVGLRTVGVLAERMVVLEGRLNDLAYKGVRERLAAQILRLAEGEGVVDPDGVAIPTPYTHRQLATMIGANREAVTRTLKTLRERRALEIRERRILVVDSEALAREAEGG